MMKRLKYIGGQVIGDYPDTWEPPKESDIAEGLADGSMFFEENAVDEDAPQKVSRVDAIISDAGELLKLKEALAAI